MSRKSTSTASAALPRGAAVATLAALLANRALPAAQRGACLKVALCGAQGSGKSTLAVVLRRLLQARGLTTAVLSLDDFYLTRQQRTELAARVHPLLQTRGVPGTHDIAMALQVVESLQREGEVALPAFDKARDDRRAPQDWPRVAAPVQVVLFEGWCLCAAPQAAAALALPVNELEAREDADGGWRHYVNGALAGDYRRLCNLFDYRVFLAAPGFDVVYAWRLQQEQQLRQLAAAQGADLSRMMSDSQLERFVRHYERLTRHMLEDMPARADVVIRLDSARGMALEFPAGDEAPEQ